MKAEKKGVGTKAKIRAEKKRQRRTATVIFLAVISLMIGLSAYFAYTILNSSTKNQPLEQDIVEPSFQFKPETPNPELTAAIVDQLSLTFPNQTFIETAASTLTGAGYTVDYFRGEKVTVEFYRNLPAHNYRLIIFRVHSALKKEGGPPVCFFTSEFYSQYNYVSEQLADQLVRVHYTVSGEEQLYFGIVPNFMRSSMNGKFQNSIIIMMGCNGLADTEMAKALVEKGAKVDIGWTSSVSASYTDQATARLLQHLIAEKQAIKQAVDNTIEEVGPDQTYNSQLTYYPP